MTAEARKNWGTIFIGTERELDLDQLSSVAPQRGAFWSRKQEEAYLDRIQQRAEEQALGILAQANRERAALLEEARSEIARMREEAEQARKEAEQEAAARLAESRSLQAEAARLHEEARSLHSGAEAAGHAAGIEQAQAELAHFRAVMGESVGAVLLAVRAQCDRIFEAWKEELCALLLACVEKGTGLALDRDRALLLERLFLDSVKLFEERDSVLVRVQPDDEALVADMFAAAKERIPGLDSWIVRGDPDLAPGDLVLEAAHSRVESRIEERKSAVDAALRHIVLPATTEEEKGREELAQAQDGALARMLELVPKRPFAPVASREFAGPEVPAAPDEAEQAPLAFEDALHGAEPASREDGEPDGAEAGDAAPRAPESPNAPVAPKVDISKVWGSKEAAEPVAVDLADAGDEAVDAVLAEGGFLPATRET